MLHQRWSTVERAMPVSTAGSLISAIRIPGAKPLAQRRIFAGSGSPRSSVYCHTEQADFCVVSTTRRRALCGTFATICFTLATGVERIRGHPDFSVSAARRRTICRTLVTEMSSATTSGPASYPLHRCKIIHLVRHGQGYHNVAGEANRAAYFSYDYFDASLTPKGWLQVGALHNHLKSTHVADSVQLVVVSPLTRTLQTATGSFGGEDIANGETQKPLMADGVGKAPHKAISSAGAPPFIAVEWCRENIGGHPCDKRQSITAYRTLFPAVDFSNVESDEDVLWTPDHRETDEELFTRARKFVKWLLNRTERDIAVVSHSGFIYQFMKAVCDEECLAAVLKEELLPKLLKRPEKEIAVVSHSDFLFHLMGTFGDDCSSVVQDELHSSFANCEMRTIVLADRGSEEAWHGSTTNFPGGIPEQGDKPSF